MQVHRKYTRETPNRNIYIYIYIEREREREREREIIIGSYPREKGGKEKGILLHHYLFSFFKASFISFSPNTPHHAQRNHLPKSFNCQATNLPSPTSEEISHYTRHDPS
jgi:hypothetical protein